MEGQVKHQHASFTFQVLEVLSRELFVFCLAFLNSFGPHLASLKSRLVQLHRVYLVLVDVDSPLGSLRRISQHSLTHWMLWLQSWSAS